MFSSFISSNSSDIGINDGNINNNDNNSEKGYENENESESESTTASIDSPTIELKMQRNIGKVKYGI